MEPVFFLNRNVNIRTVTYFILCSSLQHNSSVDCLGSHNHKMAKMIKLAPYKPWRHTMGLEVWPHSFITSAQDEGEWSTSRPGKFTSGKDTQYPLVHKTTMW